MELNQLLNDRNMTKYRLSKESGVPQTTIIDLCSGKTRIEKCSAETLYKIAKALQVTMESLIQDEMSRSSFAIFKSNICHAVKDKGDVAFITETLKSDQIRKLYDKKWYPEAFYLLAMVDYLSRENNVPPCSKYNDIRACKLKQPLYPTDILIACATMKTNRYQEESMKNAIPEFLRFNIIENEVRNVY